MGHGEQHDISEQQAFKGLFDTYYDSLKSYLYYKCGDINQAEDLAQEVFMVVWNKRDSIQPEKVKSYLYTIATNLFLNEVKHQKVVLKFQSQPFEHASHHTPEFLMEEDEFRRQLEKAISELPEKNREVFLMNRIEKLTYKEIAERLDLSVKAVEKRMHKALSTLRKLNEKI